MADAARGVGRAAGLLEFRAVVAGHVPAAFDLQRAALKTRGMAAPPTLWRIPV